MGECSARTATPVDYTAPHSGSARWRQHFGHVSCSVGTAATEEFKHLGPVRLASAAVSVMANMPFHGSDVCAVVHVGVPGSARTPVPGHRAREAQGRPSDTRWL